MDAVKFWDACYVAHDQVLYVKLTLRETPQKGTKKNPPRTAGRIFWERLVSGRQVEFGVSPFLLIIDFTEAQLLCWWRLCSGFEKSKGNGVLISGEQPKSSRLWTNDNEIYLVTHPAGSRFCYTLYSKVAWRKEWAPLTLEKCLSTFSVVVGCGLEWCCRFFFVRDVVRQRFYSMVAHCSACAMMAALKDGCKTLLHRCTTVCRHVLSVFFPSNIGQNHPISCDFYSAWFVPLLCADFCFC